MAYKQTLLVLLMTLRLTVATDSSLENNETSMEMFTETWARENDSSQEKTYTTTLGLETDIKLLTKRLEEVDTKLLKGFDGVEKKLMKTLDQTNTKQLDQMDKLLERLDSIESRIKTQGSNPKAPSVHGNVCIESEFSGTCKARGSCSIVMEDTEDPGFPQYCGTSKDGDAMVCCEDSSRISQKMCHRYSQFVYSKVPRLAGNVSLLNDTCSASQIHPEELPEGSPGYIPVKHGEFPHLGLLEFKTGVYIGCLISERWFLSVAHNVDSNEQELKVGLGLQVNSKGQHQVHAIFKVLEKHEHPDSNIFFSFGLYKLHSDVSFSPYIRPACLVAERQPPGTRGILIGEINKIHVKAISDTVPFSDTYYNEMVTDESTMFINLIYKPNDPLFVIAGSPMMLVMQHPYCTYGIIGINGLINDNKPRAMFRLSYVLPWIEDLVWPQ